jgi:replicative DNA helicase
MILNQLLFNEDYYIKTYHFLKPVHFKNTKLRKIFDVYNETITKYKNRPSSQDLLNSLESDQNIDDDYYGELRKELDTISSDGKRVVLSEKMLDDTVRHAKNREFIDFVVSNAENVKKDENFIVKHFGEMENEFKKISGISVNTDIGFDVFDRAAAEENFPKFRDVNTLKSGFKPWDDFTGGLEPGTLSVIQAPTNGGKSLTMAFLAAKYALQGKNVLYVTCEMADYKIAMRNQAFLMDAELDMFRKTITSKDDYLKLFDLMCESHPNHGRLWVKEFPTGQANWVMIRNLIDMIQSSKDFKFDLVVVDYIGILNTTRKVSFENLYAFQMAVAIELRGLAQTLKIPFLSAMQMTREALKMIKKQQEMVDLGVEDMSGSLGVGFTIDQLVTQVPLKKENSAKFLNDQIKEVYMFINSKTRNSGNKNDRVYVGVNGAKMTLYEIDNTDQSDTKINQAVLKTAHDEVNSWMDDFDNI